MDMTKVRIVELGKDTMLGQTKEGGVIRTELRRWGRWKGQYEGNGRGGGSKKIY